MDASDFSPLVWKSVKELQSGFNGHRCSLPALLKVAQNLERALESTRQMYNNAIKLRDETRTKLVAAQNNLLAVERVVNQYAAVSEPVVASDGYTYERKAICQYLKDCSETNTKAYSHLTKEELLEMVVPNSTLRRLVSLLQSVRPTEVPTVSPRTPIPQITAAQIQQQQQQQIQQGEMGFQLCGNNGGSGLNWAGDDDALASIRVSELEATLVGAANTGSPNASQSNVNNSNNNNSNNNNSSTPPQRRWEGRGSQPPQQTQSQQPQQQSGGKGTPKNHPCLRVYGHCNFLDDCTFAHYPYEACLNYIKGKCRFGQCCKELHVSNAYHNRPAGQRGAGNATGNNNHNHNNNNNNNNNNVNSNSNSSSSNVNTNVSNNSSGLTAPNAEEKERETPKPRKAAAKEKESGKGSHALSETKAKDEEAAQRESQPHVPNTMEKTNEAAHPKPLHDEENEELQNEVMETLKGEKSEAIKPPRTGEKEMETEETHTESETEDCHVEIAAVEEGA